MFLPVENGYARSILEVQREWSLDDLLRTVDRINAKADAERKAIADAKRNRGAA